MSSLLVLSPHVLSPLFAHQYNTESFDRPDIWAECIKLRKDIPDDIPAQMVPSHRSIFELSAMMMVTRLGAIAVGIKRPPEAKDYENGETFLVGKKFIIGPKTEPQ